MVGGRRICLVPHPDPERARRGERVKAMLLDFKALREDWNVYELEDGTRLRVRVIVERVYVPIDPNTNEIIRTPEGAPMYGANYSLRVVF